MTRLCSIEGCGKKHYSLGYCLAHYKRYTSHGDPLAGGVTPKPLGLPCEVDGCVKPSIRAGLCAMHNKRKIRHGDVNGGVFVKGEAEEWLRARVDYGLDDCLKWPFRIEANGYTSIYWNEVSTTAHRVMCALAHGEPPTDGLHAAHKCGNRWCVNPKHLRWATVHENSLDKIEHGTMLFGERNPQAVLTEAEAREILALKGTCTLKFAADQYGVHLGTVHRIWARKAWKWLDS